MAKAAYIRVTSTLAGVRFGHQESTLELARHGDRFLSVHHDHEVSAELVETLMSALMEPPLTEPCAENLGFTPEWLQSVAKHLIDERFPNYSEAGRKRYLQKFQNFATFKEKIHRAVSGALLVLRGVPQPRFSIQIFSRYRTLLTAWSSSFPPLMLPWEITRSDGRIVTYNARVARAIGALLPEDFLNRSRILAANLHQYAFQPIPDESLLDPPDHIP